MTNWCVLCNANPCDCMARVQRKKHAAHAVDQMCREEEEREKATLRAEVERLKELEAYVVKAHMAAFGPPRNYEFVDCVSTINLFVGESVFSEGRRQETDRLTRKLAETETACRVLTLSANELETVRRERDEAREWEKKPLGQTAFAPLFHAIEAERDQLREQLASTRELWADTQTRLAAIEQAAQQAAGRSDCGTLDCIAELRVQLAAANGKLELASLALAKREPEPQTFTTSTFPKGDTDGPTK